MNTQMEGISIAPSPLFEVMSEKPAHKLLQLEKKLTTIVFFNKFKNKNKCLKCGCQICENNPTNSAVCATCM
jgi:hypothetical protein